MRKLFSLLTAILFAGSLMATDYELMLTMDLAAASQSGGSTAEITTNAALLTFLQNSVTTSTNIKAASKTSGKVYAGKGSGGDGIPDYVLKIGTASAAAAMSFTIADALDNVAKVELTGYGWKTSTSVSVNSSTGQKPSYAASEVTFTYVLGTASKTISISVSSSAFCATQIKLYKVAAASCSNEITITKADDPDHGTFVLNTSGKVCIDGGNASTTVTATPDEGYRLASVTSTVGAVGDIDGNTCAITGINANTTVSVAFEAIPKYTVSFSTGEGNPEVAAKTETLGGQGIELPEGPAPTCTDWTFAGWKETSAVAEQTATAPTLLAAGANYKPAANCTLYAVYSKTIGGTGAAVGTKMWTEDFGGFAKGDQPSAPGSTATVYGSASVVYTCETSYTSIYDDGNAGGTTYEILVPKSSRSGYFEISGIPTGAASTLTLSYKTNQAGMNVTSSTDGVSIGDISGSNPYSRTITIDSEKAPANFTLRFAMGTDSNGRLDDIDVAVANNGSTTYYISAPTCAAPDQCETPEFSPAAGTYNVAKEVALSCSTEGASIYYTTNGTTPTSSSTLYSAAIAVDKSMTIKAIAIKDGLTDSEVAEAAYVLQCATPTIVKAETYFIDKATITLACESDGAAIHYTLDGTDPTGEAALYSEPFTIDATKTIKAIAIKEGWTNSEIASETFTKATVLNVTEAIAAIDAGGDLTGKYVEGIICQIDEYSSKFHSITYWITNYADTMEVYSGKGLNNVNFNSIDDLSVSEKVVVYGTLKKHNDIYEFDYNNYIVALAEKGSIASVELAGTPTKAAYEKGEEFAPAGMTVWAIYENGYKEQAAPGGIQWSYTPTFINESGDVSVIATYATKNDSKSVAVTVKTHAVTFAAPANGTLAVKRYNGNGWVAITSGDEFVKGTTLKVEATPASADYELASLTVNGEDFTSGETYEVGTANIEVAAAFNLKPAAPISWESTEDDVREFGKSYEATSWRTLNNKGFSITVTSSNTAVIPSMQPYAGSTVTSIWFPTSIDGTGTTVITATSEATDSYRQTSVSYNIVVKAASGLAWSAESADVRYGASNTYPTLTNTHSLAVTYSSSNTDIATISNEAGHEGEITLKANGSTTITASFAGDETYAPKEVSYTLNVSAGIVTVTPDDPVALDLGEVLYGDVAANYGKSFHLHITNLSPNKQVSVITHYSQCYASPKFYDANGEGVLDADVTILPITNLAPRENPYVDNIEVRCTGTREFEDIVVGTVSMVSVQAYAITVTATTNGSVTLNGAAAPKVAKAGTTFTLATTPAEGYVLDALTITDGEEADIKAEVLSGSTLTMPASAMIITATFKLDGGGTALDNAEAQEKAVKVVENGMVIINYNGKRFNVLGQAIR